MLYSFFVKYLSRINLKFLIFKIQAMSNIENNLTKNVLILIVVNHP